MNRTGTALMGMVLLTGAALAADEPAPEKIDAKLLNLHRDEARRWEIYVDALRTKKAEFVPEPVYRWTNASRGNGQTGAMFVWTFEGRPVALGGVFSNPEAGRRVIMHEFHALGPLRIAARLERFESSVAAAGRRAFAPDSRLAGPRGDRQAASDSDAGYCPGIHRSYD